ncbi:hypothetical protein K438DRAFT_1774973 [Mycena galopus ATCC 62051]|nr:hypothetical protein K438DRAFT_1774973 [Mycena galopus ATCC 62051]
MSWKSPPDLEPLLLPKASKKWQRRTITQGQARGQPGFKPATKDRLVSSAVREEICVGADAIISHHITELDFLPNVGRVLGANQQKTWPGLESNELVCIRYGIALVKYKDFRTKKSKLGMLMAQSRVERSLRGSGYDYLRAYMWQIYLDKRRKVSTLLFIFNSNLPLDFHFHMHLGMNNQSFPPWPGLELRRYYHSAFDHVHTTPLWAFHVNVQWIKARIEGASLRYWMYKSRCVAAAHYAPPSLS